MDIIVDFGNNYAYFEHMLTLDKGENLLVFGVVHILTGSDFGISFRVPRNLNKPIWIKPGNKKTTYYWKDSEKRERECKMYEITDSKFQAIVKGGELKT